MRLLQGKVPPLREVIKGPHPQGSRETWSCGEAGQVSRPHAMDKGDQVRVRPYHRKPLSTFLLPLQPPSTVHFTQLLPTSTLLQVFHPLPCRALILLCSMNSYPILKSLLKCLFLHEAFCILPATHTHIQLGTLFLGRRG